MPKWSKDATEFTVNVHYDDEKGSQVRIPKPILEKIGSPDKITFVIDGNDVKISPTKSIKIGNTVSVKKIKNPKVVGGKIKT